MSAESPIRLHHGAWGVAIAGLVVWGVLGVLGLGAAMMAPMMLDAPGSENNPYAVTLMVSMMAFPLVAGLSVVLGLALAALTHFFAGQGKRKRARLTLWLTVAGAGLPLVDLAVIAVAVALLQVVCDGNFRCP